ncbi:MAG: hypothetical protein AUH85_17700 [Chloroflexi bacterium 13_1_40CM_4_68_4]|nr:MAG: hypothetical protein AUH85_17700 [Chloroflexi bacterium 13_1_40CM_4_68_4]
MGPCDTSRTQVAPPMPMNKLPPLRSPDGVSLRGNGGGSGGDRQESSATAKTAKRAAELEAAFADQLAAAAWQRVDHGSQGAVAWSTWKLPGEGDWQGLLLVRETGADSRSLLLVAESTSAASSGGGVYYSGGWSSLTGPLPACSRSSLTCSRIFDRHLEPWRSASGDMRVLVADDHASVREAVKAVLGFEDDIEIVGEAEDGPGALRLAHELLPDAIVLDNWMPGLTGLDVARRITRDLPNVSIVLLTLDPQLRDLALAAGAGAVVLKGAPAGELVRAVRGVATKPRRRSLGRRERDRLYVDSVLVLSGAIESKETGRPAVKPRLAAAGRRLAERLGQSETEAERVELAVLLRDIGKIALPEAVLTKRDPLDPSEREQLRAHVTLGADILAGSESLRDLAWLVRHHHERYDGSGYPNGLRGDEIPLGAQIVGVLDAYNAIVSPRCYKPAFPARFALEQLALGAGRDFAMPLVAALFDLDRTEPGHLWLDPA